MLEASYFSELALDGLLAREREASAFGSRGQAAWNRRAGRKGRGGGDATYVEALLAQLNLEGVETALDVGCGTGNVAVPLARRLRRVEALDFSEEMLRRLRERAAAAGVGEGRLGVRHLAWADEWEGVVPADLVLCSRAMDFGDLRRCLRKMHRYARKRCALVLHAGGTYLGPDVLKALDRTIHPRADYIYAVAMLHQMGICCSTVFLPSVGGMSYGSAEEFVESVRWRLGELGKAEVRRLEVLFAGLPKGKDGCAQYSHPFCWALLRWEVGETDEEAFARFSRFDGAFPEGSDRVAQKA